MAKNRYVALLRGINVGGRNLIKMADLKACFEEQDLANVATYIASGNVLFDSADADRAKLTAKIESALERRFGYGSRIVLRSRKQMEDVLSRAPRAFGEAPRERRYDVIFCRENLKPSAALEVVPTKEGVDEAFAGPGVLYFSRLIAKASQSRLSRLVSLPIYQDVTIRNWNTTTKLAGLLAAR